MPGAWAERGKTTSRKDWPPGDRSGLITSVCARTTAFLADDDAGFRERARHLLSEAGYAVTEASDGGEALEMLSAMADARLPLPHVLILEFLMPRLSGMGVLLALRRIVRLPPTLMLTRFLDPSVDTLATRFGVYRVLRKPVDGHVLCAAVGETAAGDLASWRDAAKETRSLGGQRAAAAGVKRNAPTSVARGNRYGGLT
jgi:two-component system, chemotaxis family, chemotaxis protein CheY